MSTRVFYIVFSFLSILFLLGIFRNVNAAYVFALTLLVFLLLFLFAQQQLKGAPASTMKYLYLAIAAMFIAFLFLSRVYKFYNHLMGIMFLLLANLAYTKLFYKFSDFRIKPLIPFLLITFVVIGTIIFLLFDFYGTYYGLGLVYMFLLLDCLQVAWLRRNRVHRISFRLVFYGMLLFFLVQVVSFFNHVQLHLRWLTAIKGILYLLSQLMIIRGLKLERAAMVDHEEVI